MPRLIKKPMVSLYDRIPPCQRKKVGLSKTHFAVYMYLADHPSATHEMIHEATGYSKVHVKQIIWMLRHKFKAIRRVDGYAICDLRLGGRANAWEMTVFGAIPKEDYCLYFNEDGTRKFRGIHDGITSTSAKMVFTTELISSEILKFLLAGGKTKMSVWSYWDFAKAMGCGMRSVGRPDQRLMELSKKLNETLKHGTDVELTEMILENRDTVRKHKPTIIVEELENEDIT